MFPTNQSLKSKFLVEGALCLALSLILSSLKLFTLPQGGSITLEMLPLLFFAFRRGLKWGLLVGLLSGFLQIFLGGYIFHPLQAILDYPLAMTAMGLGGIFPNHKLLSSLIAGAFRLFCHTLAGVIFFASYAPIGENVWLYSLIYNATFLIPSLFLSAFIALILWKKLNQAGV